MSHDPRMREHDPQPTNEELYLVCPQCRKRFYPIWDDSNNLKQTLIIRSCPSGGIYDVHIECPHCDFHEDL